MDNVEKDRIKKKRGRKGEDLACAFLEQNGYRVIERNFRCKMGEIDIVATDGEYICFTEVKARTRTDYGMPRDAVDRRKQQRIARAAILYLIGKEWQNRLTRFDIAEVSPDDVLYIPDAFQPGDLVYR